MLFRSSEFRNPVQLITKNHLILRDLDLLTGMARRNLVSAFITVTTLDDDLELEVPAGTQHGMVFRERGRGVPVLQGRGRGDLLVQVEVEVPQRLNEEEAALLREFAARRGEETTEAGDHGFLSRLRSAFQ